MELTEERKAPAISRGESGMSLMWGGGLLDIFDCHGMAWKGMGG
jgi:hypothetical protein